MKIRNGFVSNSSSSSFTCDVCGREESGMDLCLSDCEMTRCVNDHTFCNEHRSIGPDDISLEEKRKSLIDDILSSSWKKDADKTKESDEIRNMTEDDLNERFQEFVDDETPAVMCPVCRMEVVLDHDMLAYFLLKHHTSREDLKKEIQEKFKGDFSAFRKEIYNL